MADVNMTERRDTVVDEGYNYRRFRPRVLANDARLMLTPAGPVPGDPAPGIALSDTEQRPWNLSDRRDRPVVIVFGSGT